MVWTRTMETLGSGSLGSVAVVECIDLIYLIPSHISVAVFFGRYFGTWVEISIDNLSSYSFIYNIDLHTMQQC